MWAKEEGNLWKSEIMINLCNIGVFVSYLCLIFRQYRLSIVQGNASECPRASLSEIIDASKLPLIIEFKPGVKEIKGMSLEMGSIGNHSLCYRAILQDKAGIF